MAEGDIGAVLGNLEFDDVDGAAPEILHVAGIVYAVAYGGPLGAGWIKTVTISADGATVALVDGGSLEFDAVGSMVDFIHVTGHVFAVAYRGPDDDGWIKTVTISDDGATIALAGGSLEFDNAYCQWPCIIHVGGTVYAIAYEAFAYDGTIKAITISADGATIALAGGNLMFENVCPFDSNIAHVTNNVFVIAYQTSGPILRIKTVTISADGATVALADGSLDFALSIGTTSEIIKITDSVFAVAYTGPDNDGWIKTVTISADGATIALAGGSLEFDTSYCLYPDIRRISSNVYAIAYTSTLNHGWIKTVTISDDGVISFRDETGLDFNPLGCSRPDMVFTAGNVYAIAYMGAGNDGFVTTVEIETVAAAGRIQHLLLIGIG